MTVGLSRVFRRGPDAPAEGINTRTIASADRLLTPLEPGVGFDSKALFTERYDTIRRALEAHREQGVLVVAFDADGTPLAQGWLRATLDKTRSAIIGRHTACGITVPTAGRNVSLRHLAVLVRATSHTEARVRVLDLHTSRGFTDENGEVLSAAAAEGPMFLGLDGVRLVVLMTQDPPPETADEAYACIPPRVLLEERKGTIGTAARRVGPQPGNDVLPLAGQTIVRSTEGPVAAVADLCASDEAAVGELVIRGPQRTVRRSVGEQALMRGILVGRYERCAVGLDTGRLSRVHFLIVRDGDDIVGMDTASTNGSWIGDREINLAPMTDGTSISLAQALKLTWHAA